MRMGVPMMKSGDQSCDGTANSTNNNSLPYFHFVHGKAIYPIINYSDRSIEIISIRKYQVKKYRG